MLKNTKKPWYWITSCASDYTQAHVTLNAQNNIRVWKITLSRNSGIKLQIHCNNIQILDFSLSDSECSDRSWATKWNKHVAKIQFLESDKASDFYRPRPGDLFQITVTQNGCRYNCPQLDEATFDQFLVCTLK
jgi:hypothetical protein